MKNMPSLFCWLCLDVIFYFVHPAFWCYVTCYFYLITDTLSTWCLYMVGGDVLSLGGYAPCLSTCSFFVFLWIIDLGIFFVGMCVESTIGINV